MSSTVLRIHIHVFRFISDFAFSPVRGALSRACQFFEDKMALREASADHVHLPGLRRRFDSIRFAAQ